MIFFRTLIISLFLLPNLLLSENHTWKYLSKTSNGIAFISEITPHENENKYITFMVMYDSYKGLTAANGAKYFSKKENYTVNCNLREFYISYVTAWDGRNGNGNIVFNHINLKIIKEDGIKLIREVLRKHYFQTPVMIQVQKK